MNFFRKLEDKNGLILHCNFEDEDGFLHLADYSLSENSLKDALITKFLMDIVNKDFSIDTGFIILLDDMIKNYFNKELSLINEKFVISDDLLTDIYYEIKKFWPYNDIGELYRLVDANLTWDSLPADLPYSLKYLLNQNYN